MSAINNIIKSTLRDGLSEIAKKHTDTPNIPINKVQLVVYADSEEGEVKYKALKEWRFAKDLTIDNIIAGLDILGKKQIAPDFLKSAILRKQKQYNSQIERTQFVIFTNDEKATDINIWLYVDGKDIEAVTIDWVLGN